MDTQESPEAAPEESTADRRELLAQQFEQSEAPQEAPEAPVEAAEAQDEPDEPPVWEKPPTSWKRDYHEAWGKADPTLRQYVWQREEEMREGIRASLDRASFGEKMQKAIEPYMQTIQGLGIEPSAAVQALMQADHILRTAQPEQKQAYLAQLAQQYGVNLGSMDGYQPGPVDPQIYNLQNELNAVRGEVVGWKQQQEQAQAATLQAEINEFAKTAEFFEDARENMILLLQSGAASNLQDAYRKAIRLDDTLFEREQQSRQAEAEAKKRAEADKAAKSAKAAAVSVRSSTPGVKMAPKAQDRRSLLLEQLNDIADRF